MDLVYLAGAAVFVALIIALALACNRLAERKQGGRQ